MPLTYRGHSLGQRCGICEHLSPTQSVPGIDRWLACEVELSSTLQASRRLSAMKIFLCEHHLQTQRTPVRRFDPYNGGMVENSTNSFAFRTNLNTSAIHRRYTGYPVEQIVERLCQFQPATTSW